MTALIDAISQSAAKVTARPLTQEADFWQVRNFLQRSYALTPLAFNWEVRRWDGQRFYNRDATWDAHRLGAVQLWENREGELVGVVNGEGSGEAHLQLHPAYRALEADMVAWAETALAAPRAEGAQCQLEIFAYEYDLPRQELLAQRGYTKLVDGGVTRRLQLTTQPLETPTIAPGYTLCTTNPADLVDCQRIADLLNAAFNRTFHNALEYQNFTRFAPSFRTDLDLVAVTPDGSFAAYVGIPYDEPNRLGIFEPVCTHPDHRRHGLARVLMVEGLHRLKALGAVDVMVGTGDMIPANRLYDSLGFTEVCKGYVWRKVF